MENFDIKFALKNLRFAGPKAIMEFKNDVAVSMPRESMSRKDMTAISIADEKKVYEWNTFYEQELDTIKKLQNFGIMTCDARPCEITYENRVLKSICRKTFQYYESRGIVIVDRSSLHRQQTHRMDASSYFSEWKRFLQPAINDVLKLAEGCYFSLGDSLTIALVKEADKLIARVLVFDLTAEEMQVISKPKAENIAKTNTLIDLVVKICVDAVSEQTDDLKSLETLIFRLCRFFKVQ